jgi:type III secretion protein N (ATPase)
VSGETKPQPSLSLSPSGMVSLDRALRALEGARPWVARGRVTQAVGLALSASLPGARIGDLCEVERAGDVALPAEVTGFRGEEAILLPLGELRGVGPDSAVTATGEPLRLVVGEALLGRVLDGLGRPLDAGAPLAGPGFEPWDLDRPAPDPLARARVARRLSTGVRAIDGLLTLGQGQRIGLFAGAGVGKSTLLGQLARGSDADVNVVCLIGERGREVRDFLDESLGVEGLRRSVVVCATSDQPSLVRLRSAATATAIAEWFRARGQRVLLLVDSLTRFARAQREVGLASGEPPARQGYPPSVFAALPRLLERAGNDARGSITAIYTVLVAGGDMDEPIADEVRGILDGHIVLSRRLAERGHYPAIDVCASLSRVMDSLVDEPHRRAAQALRQVVSIYEEKRDLVVLGAYRRGQDPRTDDALDRIGAVETFLRQRALEPPDVSVRDRLLQLFPGANAPG